MLKEHHDILLIQSSSSNPSLFKNSKFFLQVRAKLPADLPPGLTYVLTSEVTR